MLLTLANSVKRLINIIVSHLNHRRSSSNCRTLSNVLNSHVTAWYLRSTMWHSYGWHLVVTSASQGRSRHAEILQTRCTVIKVAMNRSSRASIESNLVAVQPTQCCSILQRSLVWEALGRLRVICILTKASRFASWQILTQIYIFKYFFRIRLTPRHLDKTRGNQKSHAKQRKILLSVHIKIYLLCPQNCSALFVSRARTYVICHSTKLSLRSWVSEGFFPGEGQ